MVAEPLKNIQNELPAGVDKPANNLIYGASILSILLSLFTVKRNPSIASFFGLWAPTILGLAIFMKENKLIDMQRRQIPTV